MTSPQHGAGAGTVFPVLRKTAILSNTVPGRVPCFSKPWNNKVSVQLKTSNFGQHGAGPGTVFLNTLRSKSVVLSTFWKAESLLPLGDGTFFPSASLCMSVFRVFWRARPILLTTLQDAKGTNQQEQDDRDPKSRIPSSIGRWHFFSKCHPMHVR